MNKAVTRSAHTWTVDGTRCYWKENRTLLLEVIKTHWKAVGGNKFGEHLWYHRHAANGQTYLLSPWSRVLLEKLTGSAASQEIARIFGTRRFITVLTSARHQSLSWANSIHSPQPPPTSWRSILILSSHLGLGLPSGIFPSGLPTRTLWTPLPCPIRATCPVQLINDDDDDNNNNNNPRQ